MVAWMARPPRPSKQGVPRYVFGSESVIVSAGHDAPGVARETGTQALGAPVGHDFALRRTSR